MIIGKAYDYTVDNWAIGVLLYEMLVGRPLFEFLHKNGTLLAITTCDLIVPMDISEDPSELI
ncbi:unnamed protein product [Angiostrongylus costaricensis]|uniref:Protein kinase domain-containing protein n=1 Tax=Angiostrongylus costaricensis TaxID=334426 RepID=A0A0R3PTU3_ANGCS|nr:unnamed protein product [Angiostrongylus costaricensis]